MWHAHLARDFTGGRLVLWLCHADARQVCDLPEVVFLSTGGLRPRTGRRLAARGGAIARDARATSPYCITELTASIDDDWGNTQGTDQENASYISDSVHASIGIEDLMKEVSGVGSPAGAGPAAFYRRAAATPGR